MDAWFSNPFFIALISTLLVSGLFYVLDYFITRYKNKTSINKANEMIISKVVTYMFSHKEFDDFILESVIEGASRTQGVKKERLHTTHEFRSIIILRLIDNVTFNNEEKKVIIHNISSIKSEEERLKIEEELTKEAKDRMDRLLGRDNPNKSILRNKNLVSLVFIIYLYALIFFFTVYIFGDSFYIEINNFLGDNLIPVVSVVVGVASLVSAFVVLIISSKINKSK